MTITDDIEIAQKRLNEAARHLLGAPDMFKAVSYNGMYQGHKISLEYSKYLKKCKERVATAKRKLKALDRKYCRMMKCKR